VFADNNINVNFEIKTEFYFVGQPQPVFNTITSVITKLKLSINGLLIIPTLEFVSSTTGEAVVFQIQNFDTTLLNDLVYRKAIENVYIPEINSLLSGGFPIPSIPNLNLVNPQIVYQQK
jgi:hypothetical protein